MNIFRTYLLWMTALSALFVTACAAPTRTTPEATPPTQAVHARLERMVDQSLPPVLGEDNSALVQRMLRPRMGAPLSRSFDIDTAFGRTLGQRPSHLTAPCETYRRGTRGEAKPGDCVAEYGEEAGDGAYTRLTIEDNLASGNITYLSRPSVRALSPNDIQSLRISDADAHERARTFLQEAFGLDLAEIPRPPRGTRDLSVSSLNIGFGHQDQLDPIPPITVQKVVHLKRAFAVEGISDPVSGHSLPFIPAPGNATVAIGQEGVALAFLENWQELRIDPRMNARNAKTRKELVAEIVEDLTSEQLVDVHSVSAMLVLSSDWRDTHGYLLPSIEVQVLPVARDLTQAEQQALAGKGTAGFIREYPLIRRTQEELDAR